MSKGLTIKEFNERIAKFGEFFFGQIKEGIDVDEDRLELLIKEVNEISKLGKLQLKIEVEARSSEELLDELFKPSEDEISDKIISPVKSSNIYLGNLTTKGRMEFVVTNIEEDFKKSWLKSQILSYHLMRKQSKEDLLAEVDIISKKYHCLVGRWENESEKNGAFWNYLTKIWAPYLSSPSRMEKVLNDVIPKLYFNIPEYSILPYLRCYRDAVQVTGIKPQLTVTHFNNTIHGRISYTYDTYIRRGGDKIPTCVIGLDIMYYENTGPPILEMNKLLRNFSYGSDEIEKFYNLANILNLSVQKKIRQQRER